MTDILYIYYSTVFTVSIVTVTVVPGDTAWFSARRLGRGPGYIQDPPKAWATSPTDQFNNLGPPIDMCSSHVWDASITGGNWCN